jgi:hypothetical protein
MMSRGGSLIFGIPIVVVKYDPLEFFGQPADLVVVFCVLQTLQTNMKGLLGRKWSDTAHGLVWRIIRDRAGWLCLRPPRLHSFACTLLQLFGRKLGGSCATALRRAQTAESNSGRVLPTGHDSLYGIRARARRLRARPGTGAPTPTLLPSRAAARTCIRSPGRSESESGCQGPIRSSAAGATRTRPPPGR